MSVVRRDRLPSGDDRIPGLLPIEWVIFRNSDVMAVFDDDTLADRWSLLGVAPRRDECARRPD